MQIGLMGLGRMGANMATRLLQSGHTCVVYNRSPEPTRTLVEKGAVGTYSVPEFINALTVPRVVWLMLPAAAVDDVVAEILPLLNAGDILIDGGNSYYHDDIKRYAQLATCGIHYVDVGVSGGVWGLTRGYCLMIGGDKAPIQHLNPVFEALAPRIESAPRTQGNVALPESNAEHGYLHCGAAGAGHFVKMVHNGIEYGMMAAFAEGFNILYHANVGSGAHTADAETTPLRHPEHYQYQFDIPQIAELWRRGSVVQSWLLDLTAAALQADPALEHYQGRVSDSGEGRWTALAAIEEGVPAPVITAALFSRFASRGQEDYANKVLSAMRFGFGGHVEKKV